MGFNGIYATYCVFRRKSPILKKILQCIILQPEYCKSYNMYTPICTPPPPEYIAIIFVYLCTSYSQPSAPRRRVAAALFRERQAAAAVFRERAL